MHVYPATRPMTSLNRSTTSLRRQPGWLERPVVDQHHLHLPLELDDAWGWPVGVTRLAVLWTGRPAVMRIPARQGGSRTAQRRAAGGEQASTGPREDAYQRVSEQAAVLAAQRGTSERTQRTVGGDAAAAGHRGKRERSHASCTDLVTQRCCRRACRSRVLGHPIRRPQPGSRSPAG